jgi:hypothetical protein
MDSSISSFDYHRSSFCARRSIFDACSNTGPILLRELSGITNARAFVASVLRTTCHVVCCILLLLCSEFSDLMNAGSPGLTRGLSGGLGPTPLSTMNLSISLGHSLMGIYTEAALVAQSEAVMPDSFALMPIHTRPDANARLDLIKMVEVPVQLTRMARNNSPPSFPRPRFFPTRSPMGFPTCRVRIACDPPR